MGIVISGRNILFSSACGVCDMGRLGIGYGGLDIWRLELFYQGGGV